MRKRIFTETDWIVECDKAQKYRKNAITLLCCQTYHPESDLGRQDKNISKIIGKKLVEHAKRVEKENSRYRIRIFVGIDEKEDHKTTEEYAEQYSPRDWKWEWCSDENGYRFETVIDYDYDHDHLDKKNLERIVQDFYKTISVFPRDEESENSYYTSMDSTRPPLNSGDINAYFIESWDRYYLDAESLYDFIQDKMSTDVCIHFWI